VRDLGRRLERLERLGRAAGKCWPFVWVEQTADMTDAEVEALVSESVRAEGWTGPVGEYPGRVVIVVVSGDDA